MNLIPLNRICRPLSGDVSGIFFTAPDKEAIAQEGPALSAQDLRDKVDRPSNVYIISDGESSDSESGWRGLAENRSLESAISGAQSGDEDRALRKAFEESRKSLEFLEREVNGPVADPLEEAMARSLLEQSSDRDLNQALLASACAAQAVGRADGDTDRKLPWPSSVMLHDPGHEAKGEVAGRGVDLTDPIENLHIERAPAP
eukprot:g10617.t1